MKHLRKYKIFKSNSQIDTICEKYNIKNYTINSDNSVDVDGDVDLYDEKLTSIPLNFNIVNGNFDCGWNYLTSLEHHPTVYGGFHCQNNQINTFENFYYYMEDVYFDGNPIYDIYVLFNDMKLIELTWDYGFEWKGEIDLYKLDIFLKETEHEYKGSLREYFEGKEYKWKLIE